MRRVIRRCNGGIGSTILVAALIFAGPRFASGETAILECTADAFSSGSSLDTRAKEMRLPGLILMSFRTWNVTRWTVDRANIFLHMAGGDAPSSIEVAAFPSKWGESEPPRLSAAGLKWTTQKVQLEPEKWMSIQVPSELVQELAAARAHGIAIRFKGKDLVVHARESVSFAPYLIVTGAQR